MLNKKGVTMHSVRIRLLVNDFKTTFNFYYKILGLSVGWGSEEGPYASFNIKGKMVLSIYSVHKFKDDVDFYFKENKMQVNPCIITIEVEGLDDLYEKFVSDNVKTLSKPMNMNEWGIRVFYIKDTEGNLIEFQKELPKELWSKGLIEDLERNHK